MTQKRLSLGRWGEDAAASYLRAQGVKIIERNLRTPVGEIDIIGRSGRTLLFIEVKTRRGRSCGLPQEAVGVRKQRQILRAAQWYLAGGKGPDLQPRFDVVAVEVGSGGPRVEHIPNAFGA
ncbi:MAG: YraN family protein [Desulfuromonadales bacterium]|nr:YraN family protein [Desulfuromonadales bacterium]NIS40693.1 YraN family protein [Desulfuromonadales bacterium]